ncbi:hypothetical protein HDC90_004345 [Pedobacter sp. AK013]|uniref:SusD/RagB family nutrient-binding outer membrane lipoprotein n=1 Tax=Pedobacter sp. AK013 TaxID=2723071 RepID=UPI001610166A|nr:SusD/RagB family nutrient-binding outer membrane lipoprotein [Pedobacter sp. AK013]MBB6239687.1 hypothetical protein [Pedobacter sp. AK013]
MKIIYYSIATMLLLSFSSCKKFLDVNEDPDHPLKVQESLILTPVELYTTTQIAAGYPTVTTSYWTQQLALNQESPNIDTYRITPTDVNNTWSFDLYPAIFYNLRTMISNADKKNNTSYSGVGKILLAYNLAVCTDLWGDIPYTQAFNALDGPKPVYDSQESIYKVIQTMLDDAIVKLNTPNTNKAMGADDLIYGGNLAAWKKFAYTLKARYYLRLSKAAGYNAATQADLALTALQSGFASNADNASITYAGSAKAESPWYQNTLPGAGGVVLSSYLVNILKVNNDPRLPILANPGSGGGYIGRTSGTAAATDPSTYATVGTFYGGYIDGNDSGSAAPVFLATYAEALFIKAEATLYKSGAAAATPIYNSAIGAHMDMLKIAAADKAIYLAAHATLDPSVPLKTIIGEKYIADFLSLEVYNDWRRTGYPALSVVQNAFKPYIPQRFPYPSQEITSNPQPQQSIATSTKVWWAN